jgi:hypothetical protein
MGISPRCGGLRGSIETLVRKPRKDLVRGSWKGFAVNVEERGEKRLGVGGTDSTA